MRSFRVVLCVCLLAAVVSPAAADWTHWRGPDQNGISAETGLIDSWSIDGENQLWRADFIGRSTPVVIGDRVCANGRVGEDSTKQEVVACWDATTGEKLWEDRFNVYNTTVPFNRVGWASLGADSETGYVYAHGVAGQLNAYDAEGNIVWSRFLSEEFGRMSGYGGRTQTPIVHGDLLIMQSVFIGWGKHAAPRSRFFAFDKRTGEVVWISTPGNSMVADMNTQLVPVVAKVGGRELVIGGGADGRIYAMDVLTGEPVWSFHLSKRGINASVVVEGETLYVSHSEENLDEAVMGRIVALDITGQGDITAGAEKWRVDEITAGFPSPLVKDGMLYIVDNSGNLRALDKTSGEQKWEFSLGTVGKGSPVFADGKIYATETNGHLVILEPGADGATKLDKDEVTMPDGRYAEVYGSVAISDGRIFFTSENGIFALGKKGAKPAKARVKKVKKSKRAKKVKPGPALVFPAETVARPGEVASFQLRSVTPGGRLVDSDSKASWTLEGLDGRITNGKFIPDPEAPFQAGHVVAKIGDREVRSRVRVISDLPWNITFNNDAVDSTPPGWISAKTKFVVRRLEYDKVLAQLIRPRGLPRSFTYMGPSDWTNYTIEVDARGSQKGRRKSDVGVIAAGYTLNLMGNHQRLQLRSWEAERRMAQHTDFAWEMDTWYTLKLRVENDGKTARVLGKVWKRSDDEPEAWTFQVEDALPIKGGSPGLIGFVPGVENFYDNIRVYSNE